MNKAIFLDRDGVINDAVIIDGKPYPPSSKEKTYITIGIREVLAVVSKMGYYVIVITNQPDVGSEKQTIEEVKRINNFLMDNLPIDNIYVCPHTEEDECDCRKPGIGLLLEARKDYDIDFSKSWVVGDRWKDIAAGKNVGCKTIFLNRNYNEKQPEDSDYVIKEVQEILEVLNAN